MSELSEVQAGDVILRILDSVGRPVPTTKLVKLTYLVDYLHVQHYGGTLTGFQYMWDHFGPNALGHAIVEEARKLVKQGAVVIDCYPNIYGGQTVDFVVAPNYQVEELPSHAEMLVNDVVSQYGSLSVEAITAVSKDTAPFKNAVQYSLLKLEQTAPAGKSEEGDWGAFQLDIKENGTLSLAEMKRRYGIK